MLAFLSPFWLPIVYLLLASLERYSSGRYGLSYALFWPVVFSAPLAGAVAICVSSRIPVIGKPLLALLYFVTAFALVFAVGIFFNAFVCGDLGLKSLCFRI